MPEHAAAFATELGVDALEGQTTVSLTIDPESNEFVVVIPATVEIDPETKQADSQIVLKSGWKLISCNGLTVRLKSSQNYSGTIDMLLTSGAYWDMINENNRHASYAIAVKPHGETSYTSLNAYKGTSGTINNFWTYVDLINVARTDDNSTDTVCDIRFKVPTLPTAPGVYTDVLTFAVTLK